MATGSILLPLTAAFPSDATSGNLPAQLARVKAGGTPAPHMVQANFDGGTVNEHINWQFRMPANYGSAPVAKLQYKMASATSGSVVMGARMAAVTDGDSTDVDAKTFATGNTAGQAVAATAGYMKEISITMSNADSVAAGDLVFFQVYRNASDTTNDTAANDLELVGATLEYTTT